MVDILLVFCGGGGVVGSFAAAAHSVEDPRRDGEGVGRIADAAHCTDVVGEDGLGEVVEEVDVLKKSRDGEGVGRIADVAHCTDVVGEDGMGVVVEEVDVLKKSRMSVCFRRGLGLIFITFFEEAGGGGCIVYLARYVN